jgi:SulP family sulfate permease
MTVVPDENFQHFVQVDEQSACPQVGIISISGPLYFGATQHVEKTIRANLATYPSQQFLLLRLHLVDYCDVSGIHMLEAVVRLYRQRGGDVYLAGVRRLVKRQMQSIGFDQFLGATHFLQRDEAISHLFHKVLEPSVCIYECELRVFAECQALPKWFYGSRIPEAAILPEYPIQSWLPSEVRARLSQNGDSPAVLLIDVREPPEYLRGHIPQAQLLPMRLIPKQGQTLPADQRIVLVCRSGRRSRIAAGILKDMGYQEVYNLQGGMLAWEAAGYPVAVE